MKRDEHKVVPFPGLYERYIEKGIEEMRERQYTEAEKSFSMALELGEGEKAHFGMIMVLYQRGKLNDARDFCERLLKQEIESKEDFYEYLQVYLTILRELKDYKRATELLQTSLQNQYIPLDKEEETVEWLNFFMEKSENNKDLSFHEPERPFESWQKEFFEDSRNDSEMPIGFRDEIRDYYMKEIDRIKEALQDKKGDPYIKSIILHDLKLNQLDITVPVHKFGRDCTVNIGDMVDVTESDFFQKVKAILADALESENPTLFNMALQLWEHFMVTMYPVPLEPGDPSVWSAAIYQTVHLMNGMDKDGSEIAEFFNVSLSDLRIAVDKIKEAEKSTAI